MPLDPPTVPAADGLPLLASWYDPALCDESPINCNGDPTTLAIIPMSDALYRRVVACPVEWIGRNTTTVITIDGLGEFWCMDTGGAIKVSYLRVYTGAGFAYAWVVVIDFLWPHEEPPWFERELFYDWRREWRSVGEFYP